MIGLLVLLGLNNRATNKRKEAGYSVGLLGARDYPLPAGGHSAEFVNRTGRPGAAMTSVQRQLWTVTSGVCARTIRLRSARPSGLAQV